MRTGDGDKNGNCFELASLVALAKSLVTMQCHGCDRPYWVRPIARSLGYTTCWDHCINFKCISFSFSTRVESRGTRVIRRWGLMLHKIVSRHRMGLRMGLTKPIALHLLRIVITTPS